MKFKNKTLQSRQSGFALFLVLVMMIVIAFLVVVTMQSTSMDTRTSANDSDHQLAFQNAQLGLADAEKKIREWPSLKTTQEFKCNCKEGLCAAKGIDPAKVKSKIATVESCTDLKDVWKRSEVFTDSKKDPSIKNTVNSGNTASGTVQDSATKYRYVIEYLGPDTGAGVGYYIFRITAKGWGQNASTSSIIEETIQAALYDY